MNYVPNQLAPAPSGVQPDLTEDEVRELGALQKSADRLSAKHGRSRKAARAFLARIGVIGNDSTDEKPKK